MVYVVMGFTAEHELSSENRIKQMRVEEMISNLSFSFAPMRFM